MLCRCLLAAALLAATSIAAAADTADPFHVGEVIRQFHPAVQRHWRGANTQALVTRIWYPVDRTTPEQPRDIGPPGHALFHGHPVADGGLSPAQPRYPLLLLSHGTGGSADSLDWLGAALAARGYVVAGVNHPGNNALEPLTRDGFMLWWERAIDVSEVTDGLLGDPVFGPHIDRNRIGAVGFSLGGYTVLELAGARTQLQAFLKFCASPQADAICHPPEMDELMPDTAPATESPQTRASQTRAGDSYRDPRIRAVFAIAPALGEAFDASSLNAIDIPVALFGGNADVTVPVATNIERIASLLPRASKTLVPGAGHYTFLDTCVRTADLPAYLCKDNPGVDRDRVHAQTVEAADGFFAMLLR